MADAVFVVGDDRVQFRLEYAGRVLGTELEEAGRDAARWLGETARVIAPHDTGELASAIDSYFRVRGGVFLGRGTRGALIEAGISIDETRVPYAVYVRRGTGIYAGHTP